MKYVLDTNIIIYALKNSYPSIRARFREIHSSRIFILTVVLAEIEYGARKSRNYDRTIRIYNEFTSAFQWISLTVGGGERYGEIRANLEGDGRVIGANDMIIASIALSSGCILVTHNVSEFSRINGLMIEDWTI